MFDAGDRVTWVGMNNPHEYGELLSVWFGRNGRDEHTEIWFVYSPHSKTPVTMNAKYLRLWTEPPEVLDEDLADDPVPDERSADGDAPAGDPEPGGPVGEAEGIAELWGIPPQDGLEIPTLDDM